MNKSVQEELIQIEQLISKNEYKPALELIKSISKREGLSVKNKITCTLLESQLYFQQNEIEKALEIIKDIWPTIKKLDNPLLTLDYLNIKAGSSWVIGEIDQGIKLIEDYINSIEEWQKKLPKKEEEHYKTKKSTFYKNVGILYWYKGELDTSLDYHKRSLALAEETDQKNIILDSNNNIGLVYWSKGELEKSIEYYNIALRISEKLGLEYKNARILTNLGNCYTVKGDLSRASEFLEQGLEIREKLGNKKDIAMSVLNIGVVFQLKGELDQSLEYYLRSLQLSKEVGSKNNIALALNNIGNVFSLRGDINRAFENYEKSLSIYRELGIKEKIALLLINIGSYHKQKGNVKQALDNFNQSLLLYEELGNNLSAAAVLLELIQEAIEQNNHESIQKYLEKLNQINKLENVNSIDQRFRLAKALSLKISDQPRNRTKAIVMFEQIIEEEIIDHSLTVKAMVHLCDLLIKELKQTAEVELLEEIKDLVQKLQNIAEEQSSDSILAETYRLEALLALAELDLKESRQLLQKGLTLAEEKDLESIASNLRDDKNRLEEQITLWEELQKRKAPLEETLQHVKIEESIKKLKHEEIVTSSKLFSLKL